MNDEHAAPGLTISCQEVAELVTDYLEGVLESDTAAEVEAHIGLCDGCNIYVKQMRATIRELSAAYRWTS
jgi:anti-sigma factor RsiW